MKIENPYPYEIIDRAINNYNPNYMYALFSGGHDSLVATHIASQHPSFNGVIHINTGIGIQETRKYVHDVCEKYNWPLKIYKPSDKYEDLVVDQGFPGPAMHYKMFQRLKERPLRDILREHKDTSNRSRKIAFISGRRKQESARRMRTMNKPISTGEKNPSPRVVWVNPIFYFSKLDRDKYIIEHELPRNEVSDVLCMSGECLCGAFAKPGELEMIRTFYPSAAANIDRISEIVKSSGKHCKWGEKPSRKISENQIEMPLCYSCELKNQEY